MRIHRDDTRALLARSHAEYCYSLTLLLESESSYEQSSVRQTQITLTLGADYDILASRCRRLTVIFPATFPRTSLRGILLDLIGESDFIGDRGIASSASVRQGHALADRQLALLTTQ